MDEILHSWKWVFSTSHDPRAPSLKLWLHLFPVENCLGLGWLCYCNSAFCCYHFRRLALCAFIRKYMWQKNNEYLSIYLRTVTKARLLWSFSFCSLLSFRYSHCVTLILLLSFCYSHFVTLIWSMLSNLLLPVIYLWRSLLYYVYSGIKN